MSKPIVVIERANPGVIVAGPFAYEDAEQARRQLRASRPEGDFWLATAEEVMSGAVSFADEPGETP